MDPVTSAAVAGVLAVAADAAKEGATSAARAAWTKIKSLLGWQDEPAACDVASRATSTLQAKPELAAAVQQAVTEYRLSSMNVSVGTINAKTAITGQNTFSGPVNFS